MLRQLVMYDVLLFFHFNIVIDLVPFFLVLVAMYCAISSPSNKGH